MYPLIHTSILEISRLYSTRSELGKIEEASLWNSLLTTLVENMVIPGTARFQIFPITKIRSHQTKEIRSGYCQSFSTDSNQFTG